MDIFTQKKMLIRIVVLLTILNIMLMGGLFWKDFFHGPPPQNNPDDSRDVSTILKKELNLTEEQVGQIRNLRSLFNEKEKVLAAEIKNERDSINIAMFNKNTNEELVRLLAGRVADNEFKMELLRFEQAQELKKICTPEQLEKFEVLVIDIRDYFRQDNKPRRKR
jgi:Spy/CpxP family protein refolding chaperone